MGRLAPDAMNSREKFILGICGAAVAWAAVVELPAILRSGQSGDARVDPQAVVIEVRTATQSRQLNTLDRHVLDLVNNRGEWAKNPFIAPERLNEIRARDGSRRTTETLPVYMGFFRIAEHVFAVIDGVEYRVGEELTNADFRVVGIEPDRVELTRPGSRDNLTLNLEPEN